jgi:hypothetical protein
MPLAYEQQPGESNKAFAAFSIYLSEGSQRSIQSVARKLGKSLPNIGRWSSDWKWADRAAAYNGHLATVEREATEALARLKAVDWIKRREQHREDEWAVRCELLEAGRKVLKRFIDEGKGATLGDVARALELASKLGRLSSGLATESVEHSGEVNVNFRAEVAAAVRKVYGEPVEVEVIADRKELPDAGS